MWRKFKIGKLTIHLNQLRQLHTGKGSGCGVDYVGKYHAVMWDGVEKWSQIVELKETR